MRYLDVFVFALSSNVMVCIALYRLYALRCPVMVNAVGRQRVPKMLLVAWALAAIVALPQVRLLQILSSEVDLTSFHVRNRAFPYFQLGTMKRQL